MKIFAVIDTNVIVSAILSRHEDAATDILKEYSIVLHRPKFGFSESLINQTLRSITEFGISSERLDTYTSLPDPKDLVFYEVALSVDDSYLVTGNIKHFPKEPFIVTPAEMIHIIESIENPKLLNEPSVSYGSR